MEEINLFDDFPFDKLEFVQTMPHHTSVAFLVVFAIQFKAFAILANPGFLSFFGRNLLFVSF